MREERREKSKVKKVKNKKTPVEKPGFWERDCLFGCMSGHTGAFIDPYGRMKSCMTVPEPSFDIKELGAEDCWEKIKDFVDTLKAPAEWECYSCGVRDWCSWCPGRGYLNTGSIFGCPPYFKELAETRKERYEKQRNKS